MTTLLNSISDISPQPFVSDDNALSYRSSNEYGNRSGFSSIATGSSEGIVSGESTALSIYSDGELKEGFRVVALPLAYGDSITLSGTPVSTTYTFPSTPTPGVYEVVFSFSLVSFPETRSSFYVLDRDNEQVIGSVISGGDLRIAVLYQNTTLNTLEFRVFSSSGATSTLAAISEVRRVSA